MGMQTKSMRFSAMVCSVLALLAVAPSTSAGVTDIADGPLASGLTSSTTVKPNIGFIFDDSGSMADQNMPDDEATNKSNRCWGWYKYNTVFYNPNYTYKPPFKLNGAVYSDGVTRFPDANFTTALKDGYFPLNGYTYGGSSNSNTTTNLSSLSNLTPNATSCTNSECPGSTTTRYYYSKRNSNLTATTCGSNSEYTLVRSSAEIEAPGVTTGSEAAKTNYANWYTYYRNRAMLMKAATAEAFKDLDEQRYRVGLFFLNSVESGSNGTTSHANNDLRINDFSGSANGTHRSNFFDRLFSARTDVYTPLRGSLARMGRMYAGQISGWDPVQYSCQQNFAILSTDGFWNTNYESGAFGPKMIDGSTNVGNQDGTGIAAVAAFATIRHDGNFNSRCYRATSLTVTRHEEVIDLIEPTTSTACTNNANTFGQGVRDRINARTSITGFSATYSSNTIRINAPTEWGAFTGSPVPVFEKMNNQAGSEVFTVVNFGGGVDATAGAPLPYRDSLNVSNTLADIAYYYYVNDLRNAELGNCSNTIDGTVYSNLCGDNVRGSGKDTATHQHMTTFTVGLGVSGTIQYESNYETAPNIPGVLQYFNIVNGTEPWPNPNTDLKKIDDLWHAAVNGRGYYYSAQDATTLKAGIQSALAGIQARRGSSAAAATSNLEPVAGDNFVYVALYQTQKWDGDLLAFSIDPSTGVLSTSYNWSAQHGLDSQIASAATGDGRTIKYFNASATNKLKDFTYSNLSTDGLGAHFSDLCGKPNPPAQCGNLEGDLSAAQRAVANSGDNLVNYLRGSKTHEDSAVNVTINNRAYRAREHALGDIVNAVPVYMKKPPFSYDLFDTTYATFKSNNTARAATVFVAANDGMLHAFNAENGAERWAYVPRSVMPNMWALSDRNYPNMHRYFVDGSPTLADVCATRSADDAQMCSSAASWKTILVGGLNKGGCSYYALDVTDPANPKGLWEFTNENLGFSYGNPVVAKRKDGRWVVFLTSGYNNYPGNGCGSTGDGNGHLFVVDAVTGELLEDVITYTAAGVPAGDASSPSGLAKLNAWIENAALPVALRLYGGDLKGNLWRFDFDDNYAPTGKEAVRLAHLADRNGNSQPVTVKPELAIVGGGTPVVFVGTGRYLGVGDISDASEQSIYAIKDGLTGTGIGNVRSSTMLQRTLAQTTGSVSGAFAGRTIRTVTGQTMTWSTRDGWYLDLNPGNASPGERVNVDMTLQFNTLTVPTNVPAESACDVGGYGFLYFLDINSGLNLSTATEGMAGVRLAGNALIAGIKTVRLTTGKTVTIVTDTAGNVGTEESPSPTGGGAGSARRTAWREVVD